MNSTAAHDGQGSPTEFTDVAFESIDRTPLRGRLWSVSDPQATLVIAHGLGEHGGSYRRTAERLRAAIDLDVFAFDFRGSGRSSGKRGVIRHYDDLSLDLTAAINWVVAHRPNLPRFLLGHSNGGLVCLKTVLEHDLGLSGLILSNPSLKLITHVPIWKRLVGKALLRFAPEVTLQTTLTNEQLTQDPVIQAEFAADSLRHSRISAPLFFGMTDTGPRVLERGREIRVPTLMILGGSDPIIDPDVGMRFFDTLGVAEKSLKYLPAMRHEPLNEIGRQEVIGGIANWIGLQLVKKASSGSMSDAEH